MRVLPPLRHQILNEEEQERPTNHGENGPRDVEGHRMTHCVPDEHHEVAS